MCGEGVGVGGDGANVGGWVNWYRRVFVGQGGGGGGGSREG